MPECICLCAILRACWSAFVMGGAARSYAYIKAGQAVHLPSMPILSFVPASVSHLELPSSKCSQVRVCPGTVLLRVQICLSIMPIVRGIRLINAIQTARRIEKDEDHGISRFASVHSCQYCVLVHYEYSQLCTRTSYITSTASSDGSDTAFEKFKLHPYCCGGSHSALKHSVL